MIDSHCHLDISMYGSDADIEAVLHRARQADIEHFVTIGSGSGFEGSTRAIQLSNKHHDVSATVGIHPLEATMDNHILAQYRSLLDNHHIVACGEMGLDYFRNPIAPQIQRDCFVLQIHWAQQLHRPIIIHDRESKGEVFSILCAHRAFESNHVLYHCFTSSVGHMHEIIHKGGYISIPGIVTFKNAHRMKEVAREVPLERLIIETDAPFLTPTPHRGKRNEPCYLKHTAQYIADIRGISIDELIAHTDRNARTIFGISS